MPGAEWKVRSDSAPSRRRHVGFPAISERAGCDYEAQRERKTKKKREGGREGGGKDKEEIGGEGGGG